MGYNRLMAPDVKAKIEAELARARLARRAGNEGQARVCARRAAGMAAQDYLSKLGVPLRKFHNTYQALQILSTLSDITPELIIAANHLTLRVDEQFNLPIDIDLIAEASRLIEGLEDRR